MPEGEAGNLPDVVKQSVRLRAVGELFLTAVRHRLKKDSYPGALVHRVLPGRFFIEIAQCQTAPKAHRRL